MSAWLAPGSFSIGTEPVAGGRPDDAVSEAASHTRLLLAPVLTRSYAARELPVYCDRIERTIAHNVQCALSSAKRVRAHITTHTETILRVGNCGNPIEPVDLWQDEAIDDAGSRPCPIGFADARCVTTSWHVGACPKRSKALVRSIPESLRALAQNLTFIGANWHRLYFYSRPQVATLRRRTSLPA
jgi:hypothetical protein